MKIVTQPNGHSTQYDDTLQVGDLVRTYNVGYHAITNIEERTGYNPLIHYVKVFNSDGTKSRRLHNKCDAAYVRAARTGLEIAIQLAQDKVDALTNILKTLN